MHQYIHVLPSILLIDFLRYAVAASTAYFFFWVWRKTHWQHRKIQSKPLRERKMWYEFRYSMSTVVIFALVGWGIYTADQQGYTLIYDDIAVCGWLWFFVSIVLMILLHDAWFYWTHRLMHHPRIFRHVHLVHHRSTSPTPWAAYSFHPIEAFVEAGIFPLIVFTIPVHHTALFIFLIYMIARNVLGHLGIEIFPSWFIKTKWLNWHTTTTHHELHHKHFNANYGLYFMWWDKWFGTEHKKYREIFNAVTSRKRSEAGKAVTKSSIATSGAGKWVTSLLLLGVSTLPVVSQDVSGLWQTFHEETGLPLAQVRVQIVDGSPVGTIERIFLQPWEGTDPVCTHCPGKLKDQKVVGMSILRDLQRSGDAWTGGKILDPASGELYTCKLWMENDTTLKVRGYAGPLNLLFRTQTWILHQADNDGHPVTGTWKQIDDASGLPKSLIRISENGGRLEGRVERIFLLPWEGENPVCSQCPGDMQDKPIVGMTILSGFKHADSRWIEGNILDPGNGKTYQSAIWTDDQQTLRIRGWGPFFRTQIWHRVHRDAAENSVTKQAPRQK